MAIKNWSTTAANNNSNPPAGFPEGMAPSAVNDAARQVMADVREWYETPEWRDLGHTHVYASATSTTIAGTDYTATYPANLRVRAVGSSTGTIYGTIASSSFSTNTTINFTWDSGSLQSEPLAISIGVPVTNNPIHVAGVEDAASLSGSNVFTGDMTLASGATVDAILDEDDMSSDDAEALATQQSIKAYVDGSGLVQFVETSTASVVGPVGSTPVDDTIPASTEGTEVLSQSFTPEYSDSEILVECSFAGSSSGALTIVSAIFDGNSSAISAAAHTVASGFVSAMDITHVVAAADHTTAAITFSLRVGVDTGNFYINGSGAGSRVLGGAMEATMRISEIRA